MTTTPLDEGVLARLKMAAEELSYLTGRGYDPALARDLVAKTRDLSEAQLALVTRGACSETQYRARAAKEMLAEDIARRPLLVDAHDVVDTITTALAGGALLEALDQTFQPVDPGGAPEKIDEALAKIGPVLREMRPSKTTWLVAEGHPDAAALREKLPAAAKKWKVPVEVSVVADPKAALRRAANVVSGDPVLIDASKSWCNVSGPVVAALDGVKRVKLL